jgi:hypothetical protein
MWPSVSDRNFSPEISFHDQAGAPLPVVFDLSGGKRAHAVKKRGAAHPRLQLRHHQIGASLESTQQRRFKFLL